MSEAANKINGYACENCKGVTYTINRDEGATPFMIKCRVATGGCGGMTQSLFHCVPQDERPGWEWIMPTPEEFDEWIKRHNQEEHRGNLTAHVANGGMLLRKLDAIRLHGYGFRSRRA